MRGLAFFIIGILIIFGVYKVTEHKSQQENSNQALEKQFQNDEEEIQKIDKKTS